MMPSIEVIAPVCKHTHLALLQKKDSTMWMAGCGKCNMITRSFFGSPELALEMLLLGFRIPAEGRNILVQAPPRSMADLLVKGV